MAGDREAELVSSLLRARLDSLMDDGRELFDQFDTQVRRHAFHPFVPAEYEPVLRKLVELYEPGLSFLEWGSGSGVITIMADLLGYDACGIELDPQLVEQARGLAERYDSGARFAAASFLPTGYHYRSSTGDTRTGTIGQGVSGYLELNRPLDEFDLVFCYPWPGEEPMMHDLMRQYGRPDARLLVQSGEGIRIYRGGKLEV